MAAKTKQANKTAQSKASSKTKLSDSAGTAEKDFPVVAQLELEQIRNQYSDLFDSSPIGYFILDSKERITQANLTGAAMVGIERGFLTGKPFAVTLSKEDKDCFNRNRQEVFQTGECRRCELTMLRKGQGDFFAELLIDPVEDNNGVVTGCRIAVVDITEKKQADQKIEQLSRFPEENPFPVLRLSADGTVLFSNGPGTVLLDEWQCQAGQKVPRTWRSLVKTALRLNQYQVKEITCGGKIYSIAAAPVTEGGYVNLYGRDVTRQKQTELALQASEQSIRRKMESILSPEGDIGQLELENIIDVPALQKLMDDFYQLCSIPMAIMDMADKLLVGVGWQDICTKFHRIHPESCAHCIESDLELSAGADEGRFKLYKCKNNLWDAAAPILIGDRKMGNLFTGQFFFDDEQPDYALFRAQAKKYGFHEAEYMAALEKVPRLSRDTLNRGMEFLCGLAKMISQSSFGALKLARSFEELRQAEKTLQESEEQFRTIFEMNMDGMLITSKIDNKFVMANKAICEMLGYTRDEITTLTIADIHRPDDMPLITKHFEDFANQKKRISSDIPVKRKDGSIFFADITASPITLSGKTYLVGSFRDITERKQAEEAMRQSREDLKCAQSVASIGSWRLDVRKNELTWSDESHRIFGVAKGTPKMYETFLSAIHPDDVDYVDTQWKAALAGEDYDIEHRIIVNGKIKWVREKAYLEFDNKGELIGGFGITQDITGRKLRTEALRKATVETLNEKNRLEVIMKTLAVGLAILDEKGGNVKANDAYEAIWKGPRPVVQKIDDYAAYKAWWLDTGKPVEPEEWASAIAVQKGEAVVGQEFEIERFDGTRAFIHNSATPIRDAAGRITGCAVAILDITDIKLMEEKLRQSHDELEERVKRRTQELNQTVETLENEVRQRIAAEDKIQIERQRLHDVLETLPAYICLMTPDYQMPFANRVFREWFDYVPGKKCYEFLFNRTEPCEICESYTVLKTNAPHRWEWTGPNGRTYDIYDFPFIDADGSQFILEMGTDITQRKQAESRICFTNVLLELFTKKTSQKEYLDSAVQHIHTWSGCQCVGIRLADGDGWIPYESSIGFNDAFLAVENHLSLKNDNCLCIRAIMHHPQTSDNPLATQYGSFCSDNTFAFWAALSDEEKSRYRGTCIKHGFASLAVVPVRYRDRIIGVIHLADKRKNQTPPEMIEFLEHTAMLIGEAIHRFDIESKLRVSEQQYRLLVELSPDGIGIEREGKIVFTNTMAANLLGYSCPDELIGRNIVEFVHPDYRKRVQKQLEHLRKNKKNLPLREETFLRADGTTMDVEVAASPLDYQHITSAQIVFRDITQRKRAEEAILKNQQTLRTMAAQLQLAEEQERRRIAQDIHDSIGQILAFSTMEINNIRKVSPEPLARTLDTISGHLDKAIKQARTLSFDLSPSTLYDLGFQVAIEDLVDRFSKERNIPCHFQDCPTDLSMGDDVKILLYRSVRELLINAAKHAMANRIKVSLLHSSSEVHIIVEDDGRGFDPATLQDSSKQIGGFGLFSIRERLNHVGGRLKIESMEGKGTKAILIAPLHLEKESKAN